MQKNYKNKKLKREETKQIYSFPEHNKTIEASSLEEATEKMKKLSATSGKNE